MSDGLTDRRSGDTDPRLPIEPPLREERQGLQGGRGVISLQPEETVVPPSRAVAMVDQGNVMMRLIERLAMDPNFDVAKLEKMLEVRDRWEANEARKAFIVALAAFKADPPTVFKNREASFGLGKAAYDYATLDQVCAFIAPALAKHSLSHRWETEQLESGLIQVTCILTHALGHSERVMLRAAADGSGSKNGIQAIGSTVTYLERYTLLAATGLAAKQQDDDARAGVELIDGEQRKILLDLIAESGTNLAKFLEAYQIDAIDGLPKAQFTHARGLLVQKRKEKANKGPTP